MAGHFGDDGNRQVIGSVHAQNRDFLVGSALFALNSTADMDIFAGSNIMRRKNGPKICAECMAISRAIEKGYDLIDRVVVVGLPQTDPESGLLSDTLHPCPLCRHDMLEKNWLQPDTRIVTAHLLTNDIFEVHTFQELLDKHSQARTLRIA